MRCCATLLEGVLGTPGTEGTFAAEPRPGGDARGEAGLIPSVASDRTFAPREEDAGAQSQAALRIRAGTRRYQATFGDVHAGPRSGLELDTVTVTRVTFGVGAR